MRHFKPVLALTTLVLFLGGCGGGGGSGSSSSSSSSSSSGGAANTPPTSNAGPAQSVDTGTTVTLDGSASSDSDGTIASYAWTQTAGATVTLSNPSIAKPTFSAPAVVGAATLTFSLVVTDNRGAASAASTVNITVNPLVTGNVTFNGLVRFARVDFRTPLPRGLDYANPVNRPARGVLVRALTAGTQTERATAVTADDGTFSMSLPPNTSIDIQVTAHMQRAGTPGWDVRVQNGSTGTSPYTYTHGTSFNSSVGSAQTINIPLGINAAGTSTGTGVSARFSGPFAILDTIYTAIEAVRSVAPDTVFPTLIIDWGTQQGGTFFQNSSPQHIALLSDLSEDTDEFDQHVIAHEFGHYIEHNFSRADNIGGPHAIGDKVDPRLAFGEGWGYAFAAMVLNDPDARDSFFGDVTPNDGIDNEVHASGGFNIETNPAGANGCWCSESSVYSILYDLFDNAADSNDAVALGLQPIWNVLTGAQKNTPAFTTIFSFITALKGEQAASATAINTLVAAQNIDAATMDAFGTTETHFPANLPSAAVLPVYKSATIGGPAATLRTVDDAGSTQNRDGNFNKLGARRFVRFNNASTRNVTITLGTSNPDADQDPDFELWRAGSRIGSSTSPPPGPETHTFTSLAAGDYVLEVYDCANGCKTPEGVSGDYDLSVTLTSP